MGAAGRLLELHDALNAAGLPHAFGGAIALAYCTREPRESHDLDVNVFVAPSQANDVLAVLPGGVARSASLLTRCASLDYVGP